MYPGGLVSSIPDAEFGRRSHSRNPLIFGLFARMHLVEQVGSGIGRIRDLMNTAGLPEPVFQKEGMFTVIFLRSEKSAQENAQETAQEILKLILRNGSITSTEMAKAIGISKRTVSKIIAEFKIKGIIKRDGPTKSGKWKIIIEN